LPKSEAAIGNYGTEPIADPFFADLFLHLLDALEFDSCGTLRFFRWYACANVFISQHFQVGLKFPAEICIQTISYEEISQETSDSHKERHAGLLSTKLSKLA
jgi:hypothetical protein